LKAEAGYRLRVTATLPFMVSPAAGQFKAAGCAGPLRGKGLELAGGGRFLLGMRLTAACARGP
jgi:hypothetical protein